MKLDEGNKYDNAPTYVVMLDENRPPVGSERVIVVSDGSSDDDSSRTVSMEHE